jgi:hypothetical protein
MIRYAIKNTFWSIHTANVEKNFFYYQAFTHKIEKIFGCDFGTVGFHGFSDFCERF